MKGTAETLLDDVTEIVRERRVLLPPPETVQPADSVSRPDSAWFLRLSGSAPRADVADLLGSYGIWCTRVDRRGDRTYVLTCAASAARLQTALDAVRAATGASVAALPAIEGDAAC